MHYQSIGKRTLAEGDALTLTVARGESAYERIVEWLVPDTRNEYGQHVGRSGDEGDESHDTAWDALLSSRQSTRRNPFYCRRNCAT
jgi:hypothetical protein